MASKSLITGLATAALIGTIGLVNAQSTTDTTTTTTTTQTTTDASMNNTAAPTTTYDASANSADLAPQADRN